MNFWIGGNTVIVIAVAIVVMKSTFGGGSRGNIRVLFFGRMGIVALSFLHDVLLNKEFIIL